MKTSLSINGRLLILGLSLCVLMPGLGIDPAGAEESRDVYAVLDVKNPAPFRVTAYIQGVGPSVASDLIGSSVVAEDKFCLPPGSVVIFGVNGEPVPVQGGPDGLEGRVADLTAGNADAYSSTDIAIVEGVIEYMSDIEEFEGGAKGYLVPAGKMPETNNFSRKDGCGCSTNMDFGDKIEQAFDLSSNALSITDFIEKNSIEPYSVKVDTDAVAGGVGEEQLAEITKMIAEIQGAASDPETQDADAQAGSSEESSQEEGGSTDDQEAASGPDDGDGGGDTADTGQDTGDPGSGEGPGTSADTGGEPMPDLQPPSSQTPPQPPGTSSPTSGGQTGSDTTGDTSGGTETVNIPTSFGTS
ncbi:MAG: hypothetical protein MOGMAGMI_00443 [Candidatus Omnitrophica bacterium]|nr:hypothetical protein [Candidatus Omnitrophota bacterium]